MLGKREMMLNHTSLEAERSQLALLGTWRSSVNETYQEKATDRRWWRSNLLCFEAKLK